MKDEKIELVVVPVVELNWRTKINRDKEMSAST
jgi:phosphoribulokinase